MFNRGDIIAALVVIGGFTKHEANAIYHEHVASKDWDDRSAFMRTLAQGIVGKTTIDGRLLLVTSRGL